jgi:catechol 2,3-dioxygenase-like lactoylglutathione lyase family enzyme
VTFVHHLRLSVRDVAASRAFYDPWLQLLGFAEVARVDGGASWGKAAPGGRTQWLILTPARSKRAHDLLAPGLHHVAFDADSRADVDEVGVVLVALGAEILQGPREYDHEPDRYAVFFLDPDGLKLEVINVG